MTPGERLVRDWLASIGACVEFELGARPGLDLRGLIGRIDGAVEAARGEARVAVLKETATMFERRSALKVTP